MKNFLKKSVCYLLLFAALAILAETFSQKTLVEDYAWGNPLYQAKLQAVRDSGDFNTVFLGSSHFFRQINPLQFDSLNAAAGIPTKSYNLGVPGLSNPENYFLLEKLLAEPNLKIKNVFLVLQQMQSIEPENFFKPRSAYFLNWPMLRLAQRQTGDSPFSMPTRIVRNGSYFLNFCYRFVGLSSLRHRFYEKKLAVDLTATLRGHLPLESDFEEENFLRRSEFLQDTAALARREESARREFSEKNPDQFLNRAHLDHLERLLFSAENQEVKIYFVLTPRMKDYREVVALSKHLPAGQVIDLASPERFPQFYLMENSFDLGHLNTRGAEIFTSELAKSFQN